MARTQVSENVKTVKTLHYDANEEVDRKLMSKVNTYCSLDRNEGMPPTSIMRNFLIRKLDEELGRKQRTKAS